MAKSLSYLLLLLPLLLSLLLATAISGSLAKDASTPAVGSTSGAQPSDDEKVNPFKVEISDEVLEDLKQRLVRTRWPDNLNGLIDKLEDKWQYGTNPYYIRELAEYWKTSYDWRKQEAMINTFNHFTTKIDNLTIHFLHHRSKEPNAKALIVSHGWPGSFLECLKIIPMLTDPVAHGGKPEDAFHVVCPSLPGYGFSDPPTAPGWNPERVARLLAKLMKRLNYDRYIAQGGDWGSIISSHLGRVDQQHCIGIHITLFPVNAPYKKGVFGFIKSLATYAVPSLMLSEKEATALKNSFWWWLAETGYMILQATKPQTITYALNDSPVGVAAYIVEKFRTWSDCDGNVENKFTKDELLNNIMVYWLSGSIGSSIRLYYEQFHGSSNFFEDAANMWVPTPTGGALFPKEITLPPKGWISYFYNLIYLSDQPRGGHFAALEEPELLVQDVREFTRKLLKYRAVVNREKEL